MMNLERLAVGLLILGVFSFGEPTQAAVIAVDNFSYPANSNLQGASGGTGWTTSWSAPANFTIGSSSLSYSSLTTVGGDVLAGADISAGKFATRLFSSVSSGSLYVSSLFNVATSVNGFFGFRVGGSLSAVFEGTQSGINIVNRRTAGAPQVQSGVTPVAGSTYLLVLRIDFNTSGANDSFSLFINPSPGEAEPSPSATILGTDSNAFDIGSVGNFQLYQDSNISAASFDEVRIGTTWVDVVPVPEPAQTGFAIAGVLGLFAFQRQRAKKARCVGGPESRQVE